MKKLLSFVTAAGMAFTLAACGNTGAQDTEPQTPSAQESSETKEQESPQGSEAGVTNTGTDITFAFDDIIVTASLDNSETSRAFIEMLPMTIEMSRYADREYYASIGDLPENGEAIEDYENGDVTYFTSGRSLAIFFGDAENSSQSNLIRMGKITSDLSQFDSIGDNASVTISLADKEGETSLAGYDFSDFTNVELTGIELSDLNQEQLAVLYQQARYCQAMTDADIDTMDEIVSDDMVFTHMSGRQQTKEEYFADVADGSLRYFTIGMENPIVEVDGNLASVTYTSVLNADAYGARSTYRMEGSHWFENRNGVWYSINNPER